MSRGKHKYRGLKLAVVALLGCSILPLHGQEENQVSLAELKQRFHQDHVKLTQDLPAFGRGQFEDACLQLEQELLSLKGEVVGLAKERDKLAVQKAFLERRLKAEKAQDEFLENEREWFYQHALGRMKRVEHYQKIFKNPVLDEAIVLYAGAPMCARADLLSIPAGTLLVNFSFPVPAMRDVGQGNPGTVLKFARLMTRALRQPEKAAFAVLRRIPASNVNQEIYRIVDTADAGDVQIRMEDKNQQMVVYEWELPTVLRARAGDFLALVLREDADLACDLTGQARFGLFALPDGKITKGQEFLYKDFKISGRPSVYTFDESATYSMGFSGWTSSE